MNLMKFSTRTLVKCEPFVFFEVLFDLSGLEVLNFCVTKFRSRKSLSNKTLAESALIVNAEKDFIRKCKFMIKINLFKFH